MNIVVIAMYMLVFVFFPIFLGVVNVYASKTCNKEINGLYKGYEEFIYKGMTYYYPKFLYEYDKKSFCRTTTQALKFSEICEKFEEGKSYTIYINEKDPNCFVVSKANPVGAYVCIAMGIVFLIICFVVS